MLLCLFGALLRILLLHFSDRLGSGERMILFRIKLRIYLGQLLLETLGFFVLRSQLAVHGFDLFLEILLLLLRVGAHRLDF